MRAFLSRFALKEKDGFASRVSSSHLRLVRDDFMCSICHSQKGMYNSGSSCSDSPMVSVHGIPCAACASSMGVVLVSSCICICACSLEAKANGV